MGASDLPQGVVAVNVARDRIEKLQRLVVASCAVAAAWAPGIK
uniref:Uncharacterized protein n=1 Tax=Arundo donax TaxID=35708 RepID=A0A0A9BEU3_ARUDO